MVDNGIEIPAFLLLSSSVIMLKSFDSCLVFLLDVLEIDFVAHQSAMSFNVFRNNIDLEFMSRPDCFKKKGGACASWVRQSRTLSKQWRFTYALH